MKAPAGAYIDRRQSLHKSLNDHELRALLEKNFDRGLDRLIEDEDAFNAYRDVTHVISDCVDATDKLLVSTINLLAAIQAKEWVRQVWESRRTGSPLENVFLLAFCAYASAKTDDEILYARCIDGRHSEPTAYAPTQVSICQQHAIGKFHVDFLITGYEYLFGKDVAQPGVYRAGAVIVECDGHDFHEKTKQQAQHDRSRDRELQRSGYKIFRFTGSELFKDPFACAKESFEAAFQK
jgi:hypothetical protein